MRKGNTVGNYTSRIEEIKEELKTKFLGEAERDRNISSLDYTGVGFGYNTVFASLIENVRRIASKVIISPCS
jgi:hypothetical protein